MSDVEAAYKTNNAEPNMIAEGFHKLDEGLVKNNAPKIKWGLRFHHMPDGRKIDYLKGLASAMNHAAFIIQGERNQLLEICKKQEVQIGVIQKGLDANNEMVQQQMTSLNAERQSFNKSAAAMKARIRELERGALD